MIPKRVIIRSSKKSVIHYKIGGLYPLERIIRLFWHAGVKKIELFLTDAEQAFYDVNIKNRVRKLSGVIITIPAKESMQKDDYFEIESSSFIQFHHIVRYQEYFSRKNAAFKPKLGSEAFILKTKKDCKRAEDAALENIRLSAGGFFARNINKRMSIPMSRVFARLRIHPNLLTLSSFLLVLFGASLISSGEYLRVLFAGIIFQFISIYDGCDGGVAKLNCTFSKKGALFDTINDYLAIMIYLTGAAYLFYHHVGANLFYVTIGFGIAGVIVETGAIIAYIRRFSKSASFVAYNREFLDKLPQTDPLIRVIQRLQYLTRKEFYSWIALFLSIAGIYDMMIPYAAAATSVGGILLVAANVRFFPVIKGLRSSGEMIYITRRNGK